MIALCTVPGAVFSVATASPTSCLTSARRAMRATCSRGQRPSRSSVRAMTPTDAYACIAQRRTERVAIDDLEGRITTSLLTPYPPGIPLLIPGERFNRKIVDYLKFTRAFNGKFPGFATDVHGLVQEVDEATGRGAYFVDCVRD